MNTTMTIKQAIEQYNVSYSTIRRYIKEKKLHTIKTKSLKGGYIVSLKSEELERLFSVSGTKSNNEIQSVLEVLQLEVSELRKDKEYLKGQNDKLSELLSNQQLLTKNAQDKILQLESPEAKKRKFLWWSL